MPDRRRGPCDRRLGERRSPPDFNAPPPNTLRRCRVRRDGARFDRRADYALFVSDQDDEGAPGVPLSTIVAVNADDPPHPAFFAALTGLAPGESFSWNEGAHGITRWTRTR